MTVRAGSGVVIPPLRVMWQSDEVPSTLTHSGSTLYAVTEQGHIVAINPITGMANWKTDSTFVRTRLSVQSDQVYAYREGVGLVALSDKGKTFSEEVLYSFSDLHGEVEPGPIIVAGGSAHFVLGNRLIGVDLATRKQRFSMVLSQPGPFSLFNLDTDLLLVSATGRPARWHAGSAGYEAIWESEDSGEGIESVERPAIIADRLVVVADANGISSYDKSKGTRVWSRVGVGNLALTAAGAVLYCAGDQASLLAIRLADGATLWDRNFLAFVTHTPRVQLSISGDYLWVGALLSDGFERTALWAVAKTTGEFAWQATGVSLTYGTGLPVIVEDKLISYGGPGPLTAMQGLSSAPSVTTEHLRQTPMVLRGGMSGFNPVTVDIKLRVACAVSLLPWHERDQRNNSIGPISLPAGSHSISYDARWPRGWTEYRQFGRLAIDIREIETGLSYTQVLLVPVNTLTDIHHHWAKHSIESMLFHKFVGGYPDLTFRPDNLVSRGETCTIVAQTLGLEAPSMSFVTRFKDIATHWARQFIMALEEREVIAGFKEPDGSYTFRPNDLMTRAQESRTLMRTYKIPPAPPSFRTRFRDISRHWAEMDIKALEFAGYVNGFRESDGSFTFRPEQNLTRAELCTVVVRIQNL